MDYDPFEIHMQLLALLRRLSASHQSIDNVVAFLVRYRDKCADDLWECVTDECEKGSLNVRINILYLLDSLLTTLQDLPPTVGAAAAAVAAANTAAAGSSYASQLALAAESYPEWLARDLGKIIGWVVPREKEGLLNLLSAKQMLESWKTKRLLPAEVLAGALQTLEERRALAHAHTAEGTLSGTGATGGSSSSSKRRKRNGADGFSTAETLRRMEEDRERHKRVRERLWVLPLPSAQSTAFTASPSTSGGPPPAARSLASLLPSSTSPSTLALLPSGESPATAATTPQSPFTPSPASVSLPGSAGSGGRPPRGTVDRGGVERAVDREFETGWDDELGPWDESDRADCQRENALCFPERSTLAASRQVTA